MAQDLLRDRVKCAVPNPGAVAVGSTITLGAAYAGYRSFLTAFGGGVTAYFMLADGAGRALSCVATVNATNPETVTITEILFNDRLGNTSGETFASACVAWNSVPMSEIPVIRSGPLAGMRNLVINGNPMINQRAYASGAAVGAANTYTLDRWRVVTSGQALSYADVAGIRTVTAPAGGAEQVIEGASVRPGIYTLSWVGTAAALINGAAVANGGQVTLPGNTNATLRLSSGTFTDVQLEPGPLKTPFELRPIGIELALCQRYYARTIANTRFYASINTITHETAIYWPVTMRAVPTVNIYSGPSRLNITAVSAAAISTQGGRHSLTSGIIGDSYALGDLIEMTAEL